MVMAHTIKYALAERGPYLGETGYFSEGAQEIQGC